MAQLNEIRDMLGLFKLLAPKMNESEVKRYYALMTEVTERVALKENQVSIFDKE